MRFLRRMAWFVVLLLSGYVIAWAACMRWATVDVIDYECEYGNPWLGVNEFTDYGVYEYRFRFLDPELYELFAPLRWLAHYGWRAWHERDAEEIERKHGFGHPYYIDRFYRNRQRLPQSEEEWERLAYTLRWIARLQERQSPHPAMRRIWAQAEAVQRHYTLALKLYEQTHTKRVMNEIVAEFMFSGIELRERQYIYDLQTYHFMTQSDRLLQSILESDIYRRMQLLHRSNEGMLRMIQRQDSPPPPGMLRGMLDLLEDPNNVYWLDEHGLHQLRRSWEDQRHRLLRMKNDA